MHLKVKYSGPTGDSFTRLSTGGAAFTEVWRKVDGSELIFRGGEIDAGDYYWMRVPKTTDTSERNRFLGMMYSQSDTPTVPNDGTWERLPTLSTVYLNPPEQTLYQQLIHSIGADCHLRIDPISGAEPNFVITVHAPTRKAADLAMLLRPKYVLDGITVQLRIVDGSGSTVTPTDPSDDRQLYFACQRAFQTNPYFARLLFDPNPPIWRGKVVMFVKRAVIQYPNDDLSDYYGNANMAVHAVFRNLLRLDWPGSTQRIKLSLATVR